MEKQKDKIGEILIRRGGITLLALIVTIIVLLILSGISIAMLTGENGVIDNAKQAKIDTEAGRVDEEVKLALIVLNLEITKNRTANTSYDARSFINTTTDGNITVSKSLMDILEGELTNSNYTITPTAGKITVAYSSPTYTKSYDIAITRKLATLGDDVKTWEYGTENGQTIITDGTVKLKIGDKIDYDPADGATTTTYTSPAAKSGWNNDQVFNVSSLAKTSGENWRILGADEETGQILIIPENFVGPTEGGETAAGNLTYYYLQGQAGYANGVSELNKISDLYGHGKYAASARSVTPEDINKITEFDPAGYNIGQINEYNNEVTYTREGTSTLNYSGSNGVSGSETVTTFNYYDEETKTWKEFGETEAGSIQLTSTYYGYSISVTDAATKQLLVGTQSGNNYLTGNGAKMKYWLDPSYVDTYADFAYFGLNRVNKSSLSGANLYGTDGYSTDFSCGVRPVVSLQSNVNLEYNNTSEEWEFKN